MSENLGDVRPIQDHHVRGKPGEKDCIANAAPKIDSGRQICWQGAEGISQRERLNVMRTSGSSRYAGVKQQEWENKHNIEFSEQRFFYFYLLCL